MGFARFAQQGFVAGRRLDDTLIDFCATSSAQPPRFKIRRRLLAGSGVPTIICTWRKALGNRPEPRLPFRRLWMEHDAVAQERDGRYQLSG